MSRVRCGPVPIHAPTPVRGVNDPAADLHKSKLSGVLALADGELDEGGAAAHPVVFGTPSCPRARRGRCLSLAGSLPVRVPQRAGVEVRGERFERGVAFGGAANMRTRGVGRRSLAWKPGVTRRLVPGSKGRFGWSRNPADYPVLTRADRRRLAFGEKDHKNRTRTQVDSAWRDLPGMGVISEDALGLKTGERGWRIVPAEAVNRSG